MPHALAPKVLAPKILAALTAAFRPRFPARTVFRPEFAITAKAARADLGIVTSKGEFHGFEIKSERDTLARLPHQLPAFQSVFDTVTLVVAQKHARAALEVLPPSVGLMSYIVTTGNFKLLVEPVIKPPNEVDPLALAQLLWRNEAYRSLDLKHRDPNLRRSELHTLLAQTVPPHLLRKRIFKCLRNRAYWEWAFGDHRAAKEGSLFPGETITPTRRQRLAQQALINTESSATTLAGEPTHDVSSHTRETDST